MELIDLLDSLASFEAEYMALPADAQAITRTTISAMVMSIQQKRSDGYIPWRTLRGVIETVALRGPHYAKCLQGLSDLAGGAHVWLLSVTRTNDGLLCSGLWYNRRHLFAPLTFTLKDDANQRQSDS